MAGGVAKGFGVVFIVLGSLGIVVGLVAAAFGAYMVNEEEGRGVLGNQNKAEGGAMLGIGGLGVAGVGLVLLLLGIMLYAIGAGQARRELMATVAAARGGGTAAASGEEWVRPMPPPGSQPPFAPSAPGAPAERGFGGAAEPANAPRFVTVTPLPPPQELAPAQAPLEKRAPAPIRRREGGIPWGVVGGVVAAALAVLLLLAIFQPGLPGGGTGGDGAPAPIVQEYPGSVQGLRTPLGAQSVAGSEHVMSTGTLQSGLVRGSLNWSAAPTASGTLELVLSVRDGEGWRVLESGEGGPGLVVEARASSLGGEVRAQVFVGGPAGGSADQPYELTLTVLPG